MKITISREEAVDRDGSIFFWFHFNCQARFFLIFPVANGWQVSRYGACHRDWRFPTYKQANQFALTAAVLMAHGRTLPTQ